MDALSPELIHGLMNVSATALVTLGQRAIASQLPEPVLEDPFAVQVMEALRPALAASDVPLHSKLARGDLPKLSAIHLAVRAKHFDDRARAFADAHPDAVVFNLGAGLDARFHRLGERIEVVDVDLPGMIALKAQLLPPTPRYHHVAMSVTDPGLMDALAPWRGRPALFLAEGLLMYLPPGEVKALALGMAEAFPGSELVAEVFNETWRTGWRGRMGQRKLERTFGFGDDTWYRFGIHESRDLERWGEGLTFLGEWSWVDSDAPQLGAVRWFRNVKLMRYMQWVVHYRLGHGPA